jgi:hypothetical protein
MGQIKGNNNAMALNLHNLYSKDRDGDVLLAKLMPETEIRKFLKEKRTEIKAILSVGIPKWMEKNLPIEKGVKPKFMTQGSWAYDTCNMPAQHGQEIDLDYGVYLPVTDWDEGTKGPRHASEVYFRMVRELLSPWVLTHNYQLVDKPTCVRVVMPKRGVHLDIPLYVAPMSEFEKIKEVVILTMDRALANEALSIETDLQRTKWAALLHIQLAVREDKGNGPVYCWWKSDPREVKDWFDSKVIKYGKQLNRVSRYLKAWRDHVWNNGGPSSIVLMICTVQTFESMSNETYRRCENRDDLALAEVTKTLGVKLGGNLYEEGINTEQFNRLDNSGREKASAKAQELHQTLTECINHHTPSQSVLDELALLWGKRFPDERLDLIKVASTVLAATPRQQPKPNSERTTAG